MFQPTDQGILIKIKVIPNASKSEVIGLENDEIKIRLAAVPEKGEANDELIRFLAKMLSIGKSNVTIVRGHKSRHKQAGVAGISLESMQTIFQKILEKCY
jgi:uncharacterized protein (TIGR00251 family)